MLKTNLKINNMENNNENIEYPLHWGGYDKYSNPANPSDVLDNDDCKLKNLFNNDAPRAEAKPPTLSDASNEFIDKCLNKKD